MFQNVSANIKTYSGGHMSLTCETIEPSIKANSRRDKTRIPAKIRLFILPTFFLNPRCITDMLQLFESRHLPIFPLSITNLTPAYGKTGAKKILHNFFLSTTLEQLVNCIFEDIGRNHHLLGVDSLRASWQLSTENGMSYSGKTRSRYFI